MKMKRVFLKLSGEALAGPKKTGFDEDTVKEVARQVKLSVDAGIQVGIVIGGGNFWRGRTSEAIDRTKADQIGDGVYDSAPKFNPEAKKYDTISIQEVIDRQLAVVDLTASIMCMEHKMPMAVFSLNEKDGIANAMQGRINGTIVTA